MEYHATMFLSGLTNLQLIILVNPRSAFFSKNGYMASPDVPKNRRRKRMTAL